MFFSEIKYSKDKARVKHILSLIILVNNNNNNNFNVLLFVLQVWTSSGRRNSWLFIQFERQAVGVRHRVGRPQQDHLRLRVRKLRPPSEGNLLGHRHRLHRLAGKLHSRFPPSYSPWGDESDIARLKIMLCST